MLGQTKVHQDKQLVTGKGKAYRLYEHLPLAVSIFSAGREKDKQAQGPLLLDSSGAFTQYFELYGRERVSKEITELTALISKNQGCHGKDLIKRMMTKGFAGCGEHHLWICLYYLVHHDIVEARLYNESDLPRYYPVSNRPTA